MKDKILVRVNNGKAIHTAKVIVNGLGATVVITHCKSGEGKVNNVSFYKVPVEFDAKYITCKKCLKAHERNDSFEEN